MNSEIYHSCRIKRIKMRKMITILKLSLIMMMMVLMIKIYNKTKKIIKSTIENKIKILGKIKIKINLKEKENWIPII